MNLTGCFTGLLTLKTWFNQDEYLHFLYKDRQEGYISSNVIPICKYRHWFCQGCKKRVASLYISISKKGSVPNIYRIFYFRMVWFFGVGARAFVVALFGAVVVLFGVLRFVLAMVGVKPDKIFQ
jgi:hypothetical protein